MVLPFVELTLHPQGGAEALAILTVKIDNPGHNLTVQGQRNLSDRGNPAVLHKKNPGIHNRDD